MGMIMDLQTDRPLYLTSIVEPVAGESLVSLVTRAAMVNGLRRPGAMLHETGAGGRRPGSLAFGQALDIERLSDLLGVNPEELMRRRNPIIDGVGSGYTLMWYGTPLSSWLVERNKRRIPVNLTKDRAHDDAMWALKPLTFCPRTGAELIDTCPRCDADLSWNNAVPLHVCGTCTRPLPRTRRAEAEHVALPWSPLLVSQYAQEREEALMNIPMELQQHELGELFELVCDIGAVLTELENGALIPTNSRSRTVEAGLSRQCFLQAEEVVLNWPEGMSLILEKLPLPNRKRNVAKLLGPLGRRAYLASRGDAFSAQIYEDIRHAARSFWPGLQADSSSFKFAPFDTITLADAVRAFGIPRKHLMGLEPDSEAYRLRIGGEKGTVRFDKPALTRIAEAWNSSLSVHQAAGKLYAPEPVVRAMMRSGDLPAERIKDILLMTGGVPRVKTRRLSDLVDWLEALPVAAVDARPAEDIFQGNFSFQFWGALAAAAHDGQLGQVAKIEGKKGLAALALDPARAWAWCRNVDQAGFVVAGTASRNVCERYSGWGHGLVQNVASRGLVKTVDGSICLASFNNFYARNMRGKDAAALLEVEYQAANRRLVDLGLRPSERGNSNNVFWSVIEVAEALGVAIEKIRPFQANVLSLGHERMV
jgi:hypothetical protein